MNKPSKVLILTCEGGFFGQSNKVWKSLDVDKMSAVFERNGYNVTVDQYENLAKQVDRYSNCFVIYSSTQKPGYKEFLEDVLMAVSKFDNILIPRFDFMHAHENKGYQELLKQMAGINEVQGQYFSSYTDAIRRASTGYPAVFKEIGGSRSSGVSLVTSKEGLVRKTRSYERLPFYWKLHRLLRSLFCHGKGEDGWYRHLTPMRRFVIQKFIPGLFHDYRVLILGRKYFVRRRNVRKGDFRASGSDRKSFIEPDILLLNYAARIYGLLDAPCLSLDVAHDGESYALIEFQGIHFGPHSAIESPFHYEHRDSGWAKVERTVDFEIELAEAMCMYIRNTISR